MCRKFTSRKPIPIPLVSAYFCNYNAYIKISLAIRKMRVLLFVVMTMNLAWFTQLNTLVGEQQ